MLAASPATSDTLSQWLRLLWDVSPALHFDSEAPFLAAGAIHLPRCQHWRHNAAAAAHAAAHLVYSPPPLDPTGLVPIARTLAALLEDARVEALAMRELPGLARLWRPWHVATPALGNGFEALMARLARALIDPRYEDPDPWVRKGRVLFYLDAGLGLLALRTPAEVRHAATLLGHDIGQMRLQFNAKTYRPEPFYRDDHRWMWPADDFHDRAAAPPEPIGEGDRDEEEIDDPAATEALYPEWDRLIARVRPTWARVIEFPARASTAMPSPLAPDLRAVMQVRALLRPLRRATTATRLRDEGDILDLAALVDWRAAVGAGRAKGASIYRSTERRGQRTAVMLLVDQSASTASPHGAAGTSVLASGCRAAETMAFALQSLGIPCAVAGFESRGRQAVRVRLVKDFDDPADAGMQARLAGLRAQGSTRWGAALRHATRRLALQRVGRSWLFLISDGEPHDTDVHDPRYLPEDARHAVREAKRRGVQVCCLVIGARASAEASSVFGAAHAAWVNDPSRWAVCLRRLMA